MGGFSHPLKDFKLSVLTSIWKILFKSEDKISSRFGNPCVNFYFRDFELFKRQCLTFVKVSSVKLYDFLARIYMLNGNTIA